MLACWYLCCTFTVFTSLVDEIVKLFIFSTHWALSTPTIRSKGIAVQAFETLWFFASFAALRFSVSWWTNCTFVVWIHIVVFLAELTFFGIRWVNLFTISDISFLELAKATILLLDRGALNIIMTTVALSIALRKRIIDSKAFCCKGDCCSLLLTDIACAVTAPSVTGLTHLEITWRPSVLSGVKEVVRELGRRHTFRGGLQEIKVSSWIQKTFSVIGCRTFYASILQGTSLAVFATILTLHSVWVWYIVVAKVLASSYTHWSHVLNITFCTQALIVI